MTTYIGQYLAGETRRVWDELFAKGTQIGEDTSLYKDALKVAQETMSRARHNVDTLITKLKLIGYRFSGYKYPAHRPSSSAITAQTESFERSFGALPLSLSAWYKSVGEVNLCGSHPQWKVCTDGFTCAKRGFNLSDLVDDIIYIVVHSVTNDEMLTWLWEFIQGTALDEAAFHGMIYGIMDLVQRYNSLKDEEKKELHNFILSFEDRITPHPIRYQVRDVEPIFIHFPVGRPSYAIPTWVNGCTGQPYQSGRRIIDIGWSEYGDPIGTDVGEVKADSCIIAPRSLKETFVAYLRRSFEWGGFPGFANVDPDLRPTEMLEYLKEGLLPI